MNTMQIYSETASNETENVVAHGGRPDSPAPAPESIMMIFPGIAAAPFSPEERASLMQPLDENEIEMRPDGLLYLPEIRYRRILNRIFGPGAWAIQPRAITIGDGDNMLYYRGALFIHGRFIAEAIGEQEYFPNNDRQTYGTAAESAKSNCLVRCCKDLGIASELWDPVSTRKWIQANAVEVWCVHRQDPHKRKKMWRKKTDAPIDSWPWLEMDGGQRDTADKNSAQPAEDRNDNARQRPQRANEPSPARRMPMDAREPARGTYTAAQGLPRYISQKQAGRFHAIGRANGWRDRELSLLLASEGFQDAEKIRVDLYDRLCGLLTDTTVLEDYRKKAAEIEESSRN